MNKIPMKAKTMKITCKYIQMVLLALVFTCSLAGAVSAATANSDDEATVAREQALVLQAFAFWRSVNAARIDPRAALERVGVSIVQARAALGDDAWVLEKGLPPLAVSEQLVYAADAHGRDMFKRLYYSHTSPEGVTAAERIVAQGYEPLVVGESLGALAFSNYISPEVAVGAMFDIMLRDELLGTPGVQRNIFSPRVTEIGLTLKAESVALLADQPYIYLLVVDFAAPLVPRSFIIGESDPENIVMLQGFSTRFWQSVTLLPGGCFQVAFPEGGANLVAFDADSVVREQLTIYDDRPFVNRFMSIGMTKEETP